MVGNLPMRSLSHAGLDGGFEYTITAHNANPSRGKSKDFGSDSNVNLPIPFGRQADAGYHYSVVLDRGHIQVRNQSVHSGSEETSPSRAIPP